MEMKNETAGTYETGVTQPGKNYRGIIAALLTVVIFLSGVVTALGLVNVHLFRKLQAEDRSPVAPVSFEAPEEGISPYARMDVGTQIPELGIWYVMVSGICNQYYEIPMGLMVTSENHKDIRSGDVLRAIKGQLIETEQTLQDVLAACERGEQVELTFYRPSEKKERKVILSVEK